MSRTDKNDISNLFFWKQINKTIPQKAMLFYKCRKNCPFKYWQVFKGLTKIGWKFTYYIKRLLWLVKKCLLFTIITIPEEIPRPFGLGFLTKVTDNQLVFQYFLLYNKCWLLLTLDSCILKTYQEIYRPMK